MRWIFLNLAASGGKKTALFFLRFGFIATLLLASVALAAAQEIPALVELSPETAAAHPDLAGQRAALVQERQALHARFNQHNQRCTDIDPENKATISDCTREHGELLTALKAHIARSESFNAAAHAAIEQGQDTCSQVAQLQNQFDYLTHEINVDRQVIHNFGFEKTVEEIEYWGHLPARQVEDAKREFRAMLFDATLGLAIEAAGAVGALTPEEVDALNRLADAQGTPPLGIVAGAKDVHTALVFLEKTKRAYEAADAVRKRDMLTAAVKLGGFASKNPAFGLLLSADAWAAYQVYQSKTAVGKVHDLTKVGEGDLILLKSRSEKVKNEVNQLSGVKKQLAALGAKCDSTKLAR
jgi:hypothetical protein